MDDTNKDIDMILDEELALPAKEDKTDEEHYANLFDRPEGLYLMGLDNMNTDDIKAYCDKTALVKVEWINDTSCVLVYENSEDAAAAAQELLVDNEPLDSKNLRRAKTYKRTTDDNDSTFVPALATFDGLQLRLATDSDIKTRGARHQSRYYLFHGEPQRPSKRNQDDTKKTGSILDRLGSRVPPMRRHDTSRRRTQDPDQARRSMSPPPRQTTDTPIDLPDHLRGRLGNLK